MASYTQNYKLHQWEPGDPFLRADFNEDFKKIEDGLNRAEAHVEQVRGEKCALVTGSYTGDGAASRVIELGFRPRAVLLECSSGRRSGFTSDIYSGLALPGCPVRPSAEYPVALEVTGTGFRVAYNHDDKSETNNPFFTYYYLAFR